MRNNLINLFLTAVLVSAYLNLNASIKYGKAFDKPRVIITSDGEIDDECSLVRLLLYANDFEIEGIITSSSQYHWQGHRWAGDDWAQPYLKAYAEVYTNLLKHDSTYPTPEYIQSCTLIGNAKAEGEMDSITPGSQHIVKVLLDESDNRPVWLQAWGGTNTIARALKTIQDEHPEEMEKVADKIRLFFIWEQDSTYQSYIKPHWGKYNILTIISDQFWAIAYQWNKIMPDDKQAFFGANWMKSNIQENHGALCSLYKAHISGSHGLSGDTAFNAGDFRSEGDSPAFIHNINTGLRNMESPGYGGWGGRYVNVRDNTWLDPVPVHGYKYPEGRWYTKTAWGRRYMHDQFPANQELMREYFKPLTRWTDVLQNDFAARADWCVKEFKEANHPPVVKLTNALDIIAKPGDKIELNANGTIDQDGDKLIYSWWQYQEADSYPNNVSIEDSTARETSFTVPSDAKNGQSIHIICEVKDSGTPQLTRYQRVIIKVKL
jgi:hypothetical protein